MPVTGVKVSQLYCHTRKRKTFPRGTLVPFLNQARAWFFEIAFVRDVGMSVCVRL